VRSVVVVGAGVVGTSIGLALAQQGYQVIVLERGHGISEAPGESGAASWAAAGILGAQIATTRDGPLTRLCIESRARFPAWLEALNHESGQNVGLRRRGILRPAFDPTSLASLTNEVVWQGRAGLNVEVLDAAATRALEPALDAGVVGAIRFPDDSHLDPPELLGALREALARRGAIRLSTRVRAISVESERVTGVELETGQRLAAEVVVLAAGSWSSLVGNSSLAEPAVVPARGQIVELVLPTQILRGVVDGPFAYLSPRDDGRVLVGSTVELVGFRLGATARAVHDLLAQAIDMVPELGSATVRRAWAGFRPFPVDGMPIIGSTDVGGLILATGHFRNGVLLAPITAEIVEQLVAGADPPLDIGPFSPKRLRP
jgi:glycine oxidase